jgi:hypothetical protein
MSDAQETARYWLKMEKPVVGLFGVLDVDFGRG